MEAVQKSAVVVLDEPILADAANPDAGARGGGDLRRGDARRNQSAASGRRPHAVSGFAPLARRADALCYYVGGVADCYALASATAPRGDAGPLTVSIREGWIAADDVACDDIGVPKSST